ncbi:MAG TPA: family 20 glycosylhydrolase [Flavisolibacter sp.]
MMKYFLALVIMTAVFQPVRAQLNIIPQPVQLATSPGSFRVTKNTVITAIDDEDRRTADLFNQYLQSVYGLKLDVDRQESRDYIRLITRKFIKAPDKDGYSLHVTRDGVTIEGDTYAGTFYGIQTLMQMLPVTVTPGTRQPSLVVPFSHITDFPRFRYRGMHLDVARHFFPVSFIKRYIDYIARHKMNYFHWHLTDDQGWRIEIKKYPELTTTGAYRNGTIIGRYPGTGNDNQRYGGFYTQDEVKEIVEYAAARYITVVPEIEMPGHASAAIAAYPWLSCFPDDPTNIPSHPSERSRQLQAQGVKKLVQETWGVYEDVFCAGKDSTFMFLEGVMDEVLALFPSTYIHAGGDEVPKSYWKRCPHCQRRMQEQGLKNEHELQSYFIQRMEKYLNSKGRILIGWDEILEGGLAPNAVVMSWRGEKGGIDAAMQDHQVIMTPQKPVYFDHSQTRNEDSVVIGGYNPVEAVYEYEPVPKQLDTSKVKYILGAQANLWTEYIKYPSRVEYMIFPRMSALSEVLWSPKEKRSWKEFEKRLLTQFRRYQMWGSNYSRAYFDVVVSLVPASGRNGVLVKASPRDKAGRLLYQPVGKTASIAWTAPVTVTRSGEMVLSYYRGDQLVNRVPLSFHLNKATGKKVTISKTPNERYPGQGGAFSLVNGIYSNKGLSHPDWLGWIGEDLTATIDLGRLQTIDSVRMHTLDQNGSWVYLPSSVQVLVSADGKKYRSAGTGDTFVRDTLTMGWITVRIPKQRARFVKVVATNFGVIPEGRPGAGTRAWLFADEIQVF